MRDVPGCQVRTCAFTVQRLIVEKDIRAKRAQKLGLVHSAKKERLIKTNIPGAKRADYAFVSRRATCRDQRGAHGAVAAIKLALKSVQRSEERLEWPTFQRSLRGLCLGSGKHVETLLLIDALGFIGKQHGVTVKGETQIFVLAARPRGTPHESRRRHAVLKCMADIIRMR
jgi:hypothetical protein